MERLFYDRYYPFDNGMMQITESASLDNGGRIVKSKIGITGILKLRGTLQVAEEVNRNGRFYPRNVLAEAVDIYDKEFVRTRKALCRLDHPPKNSEEANLPAPSLVSASHAITEIWMEGNEVRGEIIVLPTTLGKEYAALLLSGINPGISVRARGELKPDFSRKISEEVVDVVTKMRIIAYDAVNLQSHPTATAAIVTEAVQRRVISALARGDYDAAYNINEQVAEDFHKLFDRLQTIVEMTLEK